MLCEERLISCYDQLTPIGLPNTGLVKYRIADVVAPGKLLLHAFAPCKSGPLMPSIFARTQDLASVQQATHILTLPGRRAQPSKCLAPACAPSCDMSHPWSPLDRLQMPCPLAKPVRHAQHDSARLPRTTTQAATRLEARKQDFAPPRHIVCVNRMHACQLKQDACALQERGGRACMTRRVEEETL